MAKDFTLGWDLESLNKAYRQGIYGRHDGYG